MKKNLLTLLAVIAIVGALAGAGYWGYRIGYNDGATGSENGPFFGRSNHMDPHQMPFLKFNGDSNRSFDRGFSFNQHPMMRPGAFSTRGIGFFSPFHFLWNIVLFGLVAWFVYWLFTKSGWQITRKTDPPNEEGN